MTIIDFLLFFQLLQNISLICIFNGLVELCLIGKIQSLYFTVEVGAGFPYIGMPDTQVFAMRVKKIPKFMAIIRLNRRYPKEKLASYKIYKGYGVLLAMFVVNV